MDGNCNRLVNKFRNVYSIIGWTSFALGYLLLMNEFFDYHGPFLNMFNHLSSIEIQINLLVLLWFTLASRNKKACLEKIINRSVVRGALIVYIVFMWYLHIGSLQSNSQEFDWLRAIVEMITIYLIPLAYIVDWLLTGEIASYRYIYVLYWTICPSLHFLTHSIYSRISRENQHPLIGIDTLNELNFSEYVLFVGISLIFILISRLLYSKNRQTKSRGLSS